MSITTDNPSTREGSSMNEDARSYWHSRKTVAAGLVLILAATGAAWAALSGGHDHAAAPIGYGSACGLVGGDTAMPTKGPAVQWQNIDGNWLPISTTQGPGRRSATAPWTCYAHTPTGAVLAAWDIPGRMVPGTLAAVVKQQTLPGPGQAALLASGLGAGPVDEVPVGFEINAYDGGTATITLYAQKAAVVARCSTALQWVGGDKGDWALRLAPDGSGRVGCEQVLTDLRPQNFVAWGPHS
jgi:hypothetical protein